MSSAESSRVGRRRTGAVIAIWRPRKISLSGILHFGIDCGEHGVIHFTDRGLEDNEKPRIQRTTFDEFRNNSNRYAVYRVPVFSEDRYQIVVQRARKALARQENGEARRYSVLFNNCEHFARYCATGNPLCISSQLALPALSLLGPCGLPIAAGICAFRLAGWERDPRSKQLCLENK